MRCPPLILVADDSEENRDILAIRLRAHGYDVAMAEDGEQALSRARELIPDLILLDVMMPKMDGLVVCRLLKSDSALPFMPIILVTARADTKDIVAGLDVGGDEYLTKPVDHAALVARVRSILRIKELHDKVQEQARSLSAQTEELRIWNQTLEHRVAEQVEQIERVSRLKRFLAPQIARLIVSTGKDDVLKSHRRNITVVFCDLRGFTSFSETAEPEEVMKLLSEYHAIIGDSIHKYEATLERFAGDGLMFWFNDPMPCPNASERAVRMAIEVQDRIGTQAASWKRMGYDLGFGMGIAEGYATLGCIGYESRIDYAAVGTVVNLAARLCSEATHGQILIDRKVHAAVEHISFCEALGDITIKGLHRPAAVFNVRALR